MSVRDQAKTETLDQPSLSIIGVATARLFPDRKMLPLCPSQIALTHQASIGRSVVRFTNVDHSPPRSTLSGLCALYCDIIDCPWKPLNPEPVVGVTSAG